MANDSSIFSEAFRSIRTALKIGQDGQLARSLAITSALPDEGKTTAAICLARSAALAGLKVVLVDCDLRRRASSRSLTENLQAGLIEVITGEATLEQALVKDSASGAHLLPQKPAAHPKYDALASKGMEVLIQRLEAIYDLVIIDTAPLLPVAESRAISAMADGTILSVRWRKTPAKAASMALEELHRSGARVLGAMLTKVDLRAKATSGMGYEAHYYQSYAPQSA
jgi:polysaccharide biosynthesis transport protein